MNKPNIFSLATKELSQDAWFAWILQYADGNENKYTDTDDRLLQNAGKRLITSLIQKHYPHFNDPITKVQAGLQWENIDIWAEINDKYLIIIEDKTNTSHHSDQLRRYRQTAISWCENHEYKEPICIYLKTGHESETSLNTAKNEGYFVTTRKEILKWMSDFNSINNRIFTDFNDRLTDIETSISQFEVNHPSAWKGNDWIGFYQWLESRTRIINWNYVNNPQGGFWCAVLDWPFWKGFPVHFQIESDKGRIAFKISFDRTEISEENIEFNADELQDEWRDILLSNPELQKLNISAVKPYMHAGNWRTVAEIKRADWLDMNHNHLENTIETIKSIKSILGKLTG
jgi:hypothetical protein